MSGSQVFLVGGALALVWGASCWILWRRVKANSGQRRSARNDAFFADDLQVWPKRKTPATPKRLAELAAESMPLLGEPAPAVQDTVVSEAVKEARRREAYILDHYADPTTR